MEALKQQAVTAPELQEIEITIVIPAYNEEECIQEVIQNCQNELQKRHIQAAEILIVNDGSQDNTEKKCLELAQNDKRIRVINHDKNYGLGMANRTGFTSAKGQWICWIPGDDQFRINEVLDIYEKRGSHDLIVTNIKPSERVKNDNIFRLILSKGLRLITKLIVGSHGNLTGVYLFKKSVISNPPAHIKTGLYNLAFILEAERKKIKIGSEMINVYPRSHGQSKVSNLPTIIKTFLDLIKLRFSIQKNRND